MPTHTLSSPDAHVAAVQNVNLRLSLLWKRRAPWTMSSLELPNARVQWGQVGSGTVIDGTVGQGGTLIFVPTRNDQVSRVNGRRLDARTFWLQRPGPEFCFTSTDWHGWFSLFLADEVLEKWGETGLSPKAISSGFIQVPLERAEAFRRVVAQLGSIVERVPAAFESSAAINSTASRLMESVQQALWGNRAPTNQLARHSIPRKRIVRLAMDFIDQRNR
jgi:hypothetical protein